MGYGDGRNREELEGCTRLKPPDNIMSPIGQLRLVNKNNKC